MSDSTEDASKGGTGTMLLGFAIILGGLAAMFFSGRAIYNTWIAPPPSMVSLSAYFVDDSGKAVSDAANQTAHIHIQGDLLGVAQPAPSGAARVNVYAPGLQFQESVSAPIVNGHFELENPAFNSIHPGTPTTVTAYVTYGKETATTSIQMNTRSPITKNWVYATIYGSVLVFAFVFFYAFTGRQTAQKNQVAIIFSYLVIAIFLGVPILAPVLLIRAFPELVNEMIGVPTGLVVTCTSTQDSRQHQWALNIGGYSFIPQPIAAATSKPTADNVGTTPDSTTAASAETSASETAQAPATTKTPANSRPADCRELSSATATPAAPELAVENSSLSTPLSPPVVVVEGGLVIPLYVIVLSVLGGAINMTRKVPGFQREDEAANFTAFNSFSNLGIAVINRFKTMETAAPADGIPPPESTPLPEPTPAAQAKLLDSQISPLVADQVKRNDDSNTAVALIQSLVDKMKDLYATADDQHPLPFSSYDEWFASHPRLREVLRGNWRVALLNQYMYLISAPFLAIVTYYLLDLLGLSKPGVVVVLSFSVGLISEKIVTWILGVASGYLQSPKAS